MPKRQAPEEPASSGAPPDLSPCNNLALRQAARHVSQIYDRHMAEAGLRGSQYSILNNLSKLGALPIGKLADLMVLERSALSRALGPLERDKLVVVGPGADGRSRSVTLTAAGAVRLKQAAVHWRKAQQEFESQFGTDESKALRETLHKVVRVVG